MLWVRGPSTATAGQYLSQTQGYEHTTHTQWKVAPSDPLCVAEDQDEQSPEENSDDSRPDEDYNLYIGLVTGTLIERKKKR